LWREDAAIHVAAPPGAVLPAGRPAVGTLAHRDGVPGRTVESAVTVADAVPRQGPGEAASTPAAAARAPRCPVRREIPVAHRRDD